MVNHVATAYRDCSRLTQVPQHILLVTPRYRRKRKRRQPPRPWHIGISVPLFLMGYQDRIGAT